MPFLFFLSFLLRGPEEGEREGGALTLAALAPLLRETRGKQFKEKRHRDGEDGVHPELPKFGFGDPTSCPTVLGCPWSLNPQNTVWQQQSWSLGFVGFV